MPGQHGFPKRCHQRQCNRQHNWHIHVETPRLQGGPGADKKRLPGEGNRRQGNRRRNPVKQIPRRAVSPGPDRHRQEHHVHRRKACDTDTHQEITACLVRSRCAQSARIQFMGFVTSCRECCDQAVDVNIRVRFHRRPFKRQVHPCGMYALFSLQSAFNRGNAGSAVHTRHAQRELRVLNDFRLCRSFRCGHGVTGWACGDHGHGLAFHSQNHALLKRRSVARFRLHADVPVPLSQLCRRDIGLPIELKSGGHVVFDVGGPAQNGLQ